MGAVPSSSACVPHLAAPRPPSDPPCPGPERVPSRAEAFRAALAGRERFPEARLQEFAALSDKELRGAIENTRAVRQHLGRQFARLAGRRLERGRAFNLALFSCDHRWRSIADGLNRLALAADDQFTEYCEIALGSYLQYLRSREVTLRALLHERAAAMVE